MYKVIAKTPTILAYAPELDCHTAQLTVAVWHGNLIDLDGDHGDWIWHQRRYACYDGQADLLEGLRVLAVDTLYCGDAYKGDLADLCRQLDALIDAALAQECEEDEE